MGKVNPNNTVSFTKEQIDYIANELARSATISLPTQKQEGSGHVMEVIKLLWTMPLSDLIRVHVALGQRLNEIAK